MNSASVDNAFTAAALAIPLWAILELVVVPAVGGSAPTWTAVGLRAAFPALILWVLLGLTLGAFANTARRIAARLKPTAPAAPQPELKRVLILGGGFGGMTTAAKLEELLGPDRTVEITLISDANALNGAQIAAGQLLWVPRG